MLWPVHGAPMARLSIALLGSLQVTLDGTPVTRFESARVRALLALLVAEAGRPHTREAIAELLWPERPSGAALADLRHALASLRKTIADASAQPPFLLITPTTLQFNLASDATVDLADFMACLCDGKSSTPTACHAALALRRGPFLAGFSLSGSSQFEEWLLVTAEQVNHLAGQALACLVRDALTCGDFAQAAHWTRQQLALEPWNEEVHRALIRFYAWSGDRTAALQQYHECVRILDAELDVPPDPATTALYEQIRAGSGAAPGRLPSPALAHNLPPQPTSFVGRTRELAQIAAQLANPECRLLTLAGPGGGARRAWPSKPRAPGSATMPTASGSWTWRR